MNRYKRYLEDDNVDVPRSTRYFRLHNDEAQNNGDGRVDMDIVNNGYEPNELSEEDADSYAGDINCEMVAGGSNSDSELESESNSFMSDNNDEPIANHQEQHNIGQDDESDDEIFREAHNFQADEETLYPGSLITRSQSSALILAFAIRHHITEVALTDLLHLINSHTPTIIHHSKYYFLQDLKQEKVQHYFFCEECNHAMKFLDTTVDQCTNELCSLFGQDQQMTQLQQKKCYFLHLPLAGQITELLNNPDIVSKLSKDNSSGVTSGQLYKENIENGNIKPIDITLQWNTDGASVAKSAKSSIWPIQVGINELSYRDRKDNIILTGLWQGSKPHMNTFLRPFVDELTQLHENGIVLGDGRVVNIHCLIGSVDSVARPMLQNIKQYNGEQGCSYCLHPGQQIQRGNGTSRVYRGEAGVPRTEEQHMNDLTQVIENDLESLNGVKGPSLIMLIPLFNIITSFVPDYMHNVLLGVVRWFVFQWLDGSNSDRPWYLGGNKAKRIDKRLEAIKPPCEITRPPRTLDDKKLWKASEFKSFLLYYSVPCLKSILPDRFLKHWMLLVFAMTTYLKEKIIDRDFQLAETAIRRFVLTTEELYGVEWMTYNMHTLLHLPESVNNWGAPWDCSTFMYEHFNGVLLNLFSGTQHISAQIFKNYNRIKLMNSLLNRNPYQNWHPEVAKLVKNLSGKYLNLNAIRIGRLVLFGSGKSKQLTVAEEIVIERLLGQELKTNDVWRYERSIYNGIKLHVVHYKRLTKRQNCTVLLENGMFFDIHHILDLLDNTLPVNKQCVIIGKKLEVLNNDICTNAGIRSSTFLKSINNNDGVLMAVLPSQIARKCVKMVVDESHFISEIVNNVERD